MAKVALRETPCEQCSKTQPPLDLAACQPNLQVSLLVHYIRGVQCLENRTLLNTTKAQLCPAHLDEVKYVIKH